MAQPGIQLDPRTFCCFICSKLLNDPVAVTCGHNFCLQCINNHFDKEDNSGIYSCPQCRDIFMSRPTTIKNSMIALVVEKLKTPEVQKDVPAAPAPCSKVPAKDVPPDEPVADSGCVLCDFCCEKRTKAVKTCLQCLDSYCAEHLEPHQEMLSLRSHTLVDATARPAKNICTQHQEVMQMFCRRDQRGICSLCIKDGHKGHDTVSVADETEEKRKELESTRQKVSLMIQEKRKEAGAFQQQEYAIIHSADDALINAESVFTELMNTIEKKLSIMKESIQSRQTTEAGQFKKLRKKAEEEIAEFNRKGKELENLAQTEDQLSFLVSYYSLPRLGESKKQPMIKIRRSRNFDNITVAVMEARNKLLELLEGEYESIMSAVTGANVLPFFSEAVARPSTSKVHPSTSKAVPSTSKSSSNDLQAEDDLFTRTNKGQSTADFVQSKLMQGATFSTVKVPEKRVPHPRASLRFTKESVQKAGNQKTNKMSPITPTDGTKLLPRDRDLRRSKDQPLDFVAPIRGDGEILKTRSQFLQYACKVTLNPQTANPHLSLTRENTKVVFVGEEIDYPNNPERFAFCWQVLSKESLSSRCYLEVERSERGVFLALAYKDISRAGAFDECLFGENGKSWALDCFKNSYEFRHKKKKTPIPGSWSSKVGVYLDHSAGILAFYNVSDSMTVLHKVKTAFTQPLHVGLWLSDGASAEVSKLT